MHFLKKKSHEKNCIYNQHILVYNIMDCDFKQKVVSYMIEFEEYKVKLNNLKPTLENLEGALHLDAARREIEELQRASEQEGFWNDVEKSQKAQKRLKNLQDKCSRYE